VWVGLQDAMFVSTWSVLISFLACLVAVLGCDRIETDEDGNAKGDESNVIVSRAFIMLRYFSMLLLYGGITTIVVGLFLMKPETANGRGSIPMVSDASMFSSFLTINIF